MRKRLIISSTDEDVTVTMPPTADGRVLVQRNSDHTVVVVNVADLAVVNDDQ